MTHRSPLRVGSPPPVARSTRLSWAELSPGLRSSLEAWLGTPVVGARPCTGGFSRGFASRLACADGDRVFVKAVPRDGDPYSTWLYAREAQVSGALPAGLPRPVFRGKVDAADWLALVFDDVDGPSPPVPWRAADLTAVLEAMELLTVRARDRATPQLAVWGGTLTDWRGWNHLIAVDDPLCDVPPWLVRRIDEVAALEAGFPEAAAGNDVLHSDLRSDNILLRSGSAVFVDWAWACRGAGWLDPAIFALLAAVQGHPDPQEVFLAHSAGRAAEPDAVDAVLAALAGRFLVSARQSPDWDTGAIRAFQRAEATTALRWLGRRRGWLR